MRTPAVSTRFLPGLVVSTAGLFLFGLLDHSGHALASQAPPGGKGKDTTPPGAVTDLQASPAALGTVVLTWTAVGDDGGAADCSGAGTADAYDVRTDTLPISDEAAFASATQLPSDDPRPCGATETLCVYDLALGVDHNFGLKVEDEKGNVSGLSNPATAQPGMLLGQFAHVADIVVGWTPVGKSRNGFAEVTIVDENGIPVADANVIGEWTGCTFHGQLDSAVTDCTGRARVERKANCSTPCEFAFTVLGVSHATVVYDAAADVESSDSIFCL